MLLVKGSAEEKSMTTADFFGPSSPILHVNAAEIVAVAVTSAAAVTSAVAAASVAAAASVVAAFVAASVAAAFVACIASVDDFHSFDLQAFGIAAVAFAPYAHMEQLLGIAISVQVNTAEKQIAVGHTQDAGDLQLHTAAPALTSGLAHNVAK